MLASHLGRSNGNKMPEKFSLAPVAKALEGLINKPVTFLKDTVGAETEAACADPAEGSVILLENTRFYADEEDRGVDDGEKFNVSAEEIAAFRGSLGKLADIYVSDASRVYCKVCSFQQQFAWRLPQFHVCQCSRTRGWLLLHTVHLLPYVLCGPFTHCGCMHLLV